MGLSSEIVTVSNEMQPLKGNILDPTVSVVEKQQPKSCIHYSLVDGSWGCYYETGLPPVFAVHEEWVLEYHKCFWLHVTINMERVWERERTRSWEAMRKETSEDCGELYRGRDTIRSTWCHLLMASDTTAINIRAAGGWLVGLEKPVQVLGLLILEKKGS